MIIITNLLPGFSLVPIWPSSLAGWLVWLLLIALVCWLVWKFRRYDAPRNRTYWITFGILAALSLPVSLFLGLRLPGRSIPLPGLPQESLDPTLIVFSALPWLMACGMLGPFAGALVGALTGILGFLFETHNIFTPVELALLGALFGAMFRQRYRTWLFALIRQPIFSVILAIILYAPIYIVGAYFISSGTFAVRLSYAFSSFVNTIFALAGEVFIAAIFAQVFAMFFPSHWGRSGALEPSPVEKSLQTRFLVSAGALVAVLIIALVAGSWIVAGRAAREMLTERMQGAAETAASGVPFFLETGQNLVAQLALDPLLVSGTPEQITTLLSERILVVPYFDQLILLDANSQPIASYPTGGESDLILAPQEAAGVKLAIDGVLFQIYTIPPKAQGEPARVSFMAAVQDAGVTKNILIGRTDLTTNPLSQPIITSLNSLNSLGGTGILVDENGMIIYHPVPTIIMSPYVGEIYDTPQAYTETAPDGTRQLVYFQPVPGRPWSVVINVPAETVQMLAISIAAPLTIMILLLAVAAMVLLYIGLNVITESLKSLTSEAVYIAEGHLDRPLAPSGVDEVGQLRYSFEQMRASLSLRLQELNRLLLVSQGVASSLEIEDAVKPVLDAIIATGAVSVRVILNPARDPGETMLQVYSVGSKRDKYTDLDERIMAVVQKHEILVLSNTSRARGIGLGVTQNLNMPASLLAIALRHENLFYGVLWAAYDDPRPFNDPDVRYFTTLAGYAALAAANAHLFQTTEVGRQRLEAILASTPDPVLVTDSEDRLLLANPAAWQVLGDSFGSGMGRLIGEIVEQKELLDILATSSPDKLSAEVTIPGGQTYLAIASPVVSDGRVMGRVCILRDVTHFKELDSMKSEFVSTVSHDLRSPLTLMRGYATMLEMVGELNEQQHAYVQKIIVGVESMAKLVNNLLDLGRIEAGVGLQLDRIPISEILDRVVGALLAGAAEKEIKLTADFPAQGELIEADPALLHQAIYNLVENAIKYTPAGGRVNVRVKPAPDVFHLEVQDTGIGIPPADIPRLFEKFYRSAQREARQQKGTGLGLAIVRSITERHGGKVWVESELGKGSTFILQVPWVQRGR